MYTNTCNAVILDSLEFPAQTASLAGMKRKKRAFTSASAEPKAKAGNEFVHGNPEIFHRAKQYTSSHHLARPNLMELHPWSASQLSHGTSEFLDAVFLRRSGRGIVWCA